jgi:hypothetical protein
MELGSGGVFGWSEIQFPIDFSGLLIHLPNDRRFDMRLCITVLAALVLLTVSAAAQGWQEITVSGFNLKWSTQPGNLLSVELTGPTTGWVGVGFDPDSIMLNANIILGYVVSTTTSIRDDWGWQPTSHRSDILMGGTDDVTIDGGSEAGGSTTIMFTIPLDSGDQYDVVLTPGNTYPIILARGPDGADDFGTPHEFATMAEIGIWELSLEGGTWAEVKTLTF